MTDTPRTDAILTADDGARIVPHGRWFSQLADLCRALERANAVLVRWKGEIDSRLIAARTEFPADYENSPKWAVHTLIEGAPSQALVRDLAEHGLRFDLNPTVEWHDEDSLHRCYLDYIKRIDQSIRERAADALAVPE